MVSLADCYHVSEAIVPLYVAMFLAYASVKWWKLFTPDQCSGISTFVSNFSVPLLFFNVISTNNPYNMSLKLIFSDFLQKLFALVVVIVFSKLTYRPVLDTVITGFSLLTLPNTVIVGVPLLKAMYRDEEAIVALAQLVSLQGLVWYNLVLFLLELRAARATFVAVVPLSEIKVQGEVTVKEPPKEIDENAKEETQRVNTNQVLLTVWRKLIRNPNTHATLLGLIWSVISFRWGLKLPLIVENSISLLSRGGLGMAMFSIGIFMASQSRILACGSCLSIMAMVARFLAGPALMAVASVAIGLRSNSLKIAIIQAALPQGIITFVFAKEYNLHPNIFSTGVALGTLITIPVTMAYYSLLELL